MLVECGVHWLRTQRGADRIKLATTYIALRWGAGPNRTELYKHCTPPGCREIEPPHRFDLLPSI